MLTGPVVLDVVLLDSGPDCRVYETIIEGHDVVFEVKADATAWDVAKAALEALSEEQRDSLADKCVSVRDEISRRIF